MERLSKMLNSKILCCLLLCCFTNTSKAQVTLDYYLPEIEYDKAIPSPQSVLGFEVGEWHVSHTLMVQYMEVLAAASDRVNIKEYARSYEDRPLILLTISSEKNISKIDEIQKEHLKLSDPSQKEPKLKNMPAVVWLGNSIHGNEPSGGNSALLVAYHLAAAKNKEVEELLENTIVLLDPCFNPDGFNRFANWVNAHKSHTPNPDKRNRELNEVWPGGRTNHYWFDLNRDWLLVQHPESQGRIEEFHRWKPNILTDAHEMGTNATYFFQPGIPSRNNPLTPENNYDITRELSHYHAEALDSIGSFYYCFLHWKRFYLS